MHYFWLLSLLLQLFPGGRSEFVRAVAALSRRCEVIPVTGDPEVLRMVLRMDRKPRAVALRGCEAAGFTGAESANILFEMVLEEKGDREGGPEVIIWGGVATPEAAAGFLCTGAAGIVFESVHWLTDRMGLDEGQRRDFQDLAPIRSDRPVRPGRGARHAVAVVPDRKHRRVVGEARLGQHVDRPGGLVRD